MASYYDLRVRREAFFDSTFSEMVEKIIDLENELEDARDQIADLEKQLAEAE